MSILAILNELSATSSTKQKETILKGRAGNELLKRVYFLTYHKQTQFYIKKWNLPELKGGLELEDVLDFMVNELAARKVTGNAAKSAFEGMVAGLSEDDAEVIRRVLLRDLECGASKTIANKVWKNLIPEQPQMLASPYSEKTIANIVFPAFAQLKADGARCFAEIRGDEIDDVTLVSRSGNEYLGLDKLKLQLIEMTKEARQRHPEGVMIDGELVYHEPKAEDNDLFGMFEEMPELSKAAEFAVKRTASNGLANKALKGTISKAEADGMKFQVWDYVPLKAVYSDKSSTFAYDVRFRALELMVEGYDALILIENHIVHNLAEARAIYKNYVEQGLEGIILKNINSMWENRRSKNLVKFKEIFTIDLKCVGWYPHRKDPTKIGGLNFVSECGRIRVNAGSGLKDKPNEAVPHEADRTHLMKNKDSLPGTIWELECNGWLTSEGRDDGTVGIFLGVIIKQRHDKDVANTFEDAFGIDFTEATGIE